MILPNNLPIQLIKEIQSTPQFLESPKLSHEDLLFLRNLMVPTETDIINISPTKALSERQVVANTEIASVLTATSIFEKLKGFQKLKQSSEAIAPTLSAEDKQIAQDIRTEIPAVLSEDEKSGEDLTSQLLPELLVKILAEGADVNSNRISKNIYKMMSGTNIYQMVYTDEVWRGIGERVGCPDSNAPPGKVHEMVKQYCTDYKKMIEKLPETTDDIKLALQSGTSVDQILQLKDWKKNRDAFVVFKTLAKAIWQSSPTIPQTFHEMSNQEDKLYKWCEVHKEGLSQLEALSLRDNQLTTLPDAIGNLTLLESLNLNNNQLTTLPDSIGNLTQLQQLYLRNNQLATLPDAIRDLKQLQGLNLSYNKLTTLPDAIGDLTGLQGLLLLDNNKLTTLPSTIENFVNNRLRIIR